MNKQELTRRLARRAHRSQGHAADTLDTLIYDLLTEVLPVKESRIPAHLLPVPPPVKKGSRRDSSFAPAKES